MANASASWSSTGSAELAFGVPVMRPRAAAQEPAVRRARAHHAVWLTERRFATAAILDVHGALTGTDAGDLLQATAQSVLAAGGRIVILNLEDVTAIDREGAHGVTAVARLVGQRGCELRLAGPQAHLAEIYVAPPCAVSTFPTVDDALEDLRRALERRHRDAGIDRWWHMLAVLWRRLTNRQDTPFK